MTNVSTPLMFTASAPREPREPTFLVEARGRRGQSDVTFVDLNVTMPPTGARVSLLGRPAPQVEASLPPEPVVVAPPPPPAGPSPEAIEYAERIAAAVSALRLTGERLAEQARSDALELALLLARRIVETELTASVEPLFGVVRSVIRRAGESRRVQVRLCPEDAARVEQAGRDRLLSGLSAAQVEVVADPALSKGDCMVDADFGTVDGRLDTRIVELRRMLEESAAGGER